MKHKKSIKWKIFGAFASFTAVMLVALWLFQVVFLEYFYKSTKISEIQAASEQVCTSLQQPTLPGLLRTIAREQQICIVICDSAGNRLYSENAMPDCVIHQLNPWGLSMLYMVTESSGGTYMERLQWQDRDDMEFPQEPSRSSGATESLVYTRTVSVSGGKVMVVMNSMITPLGSTINTLRLQLLSLTGVMLLLALGIAWLLARKISRPIIRIHETAREVAAGNYSVEFEEGGYREAGELGQTMNYMAGELSKVDRLQKELIANVSHDLRTPLTLMAGYAEIMRDIPGENTPENVQIILDEVNRLSSLVNDLLDISKLQAGAVKLEKKVFNLTQSVRDILSRYSKMTDYHIVFSAEKDVYVYADILKISQVVYNLINNALTYTGKDRSVTLCQETGEGKVRISVTDTGEGIPQDKLQDIWERYYKVDKAHKRAQVGTGLGLSIVKTILDLHEGTYGVESQENVGSTFWFELDIVDPAEADLLETP